MIYNYNTGDKVVCIDSHFPFGIGKLYDKLPLEGQTYVVRDMQLGVALDGKRTGEVSVLLVGIKNPHGPPPGNAERGFAGRRFAKLLPPRHEGEGRVEVEQGKELVTA